MRALMGTVWTTYLIPASHPWADAMLEAGTTYDVEVKEKGPKHGLGAPHVHKWMAWIDLVTEDGLAGAVEGAVEAFKDHKAKFMDAVDASHDRMATVCLHLRCKRAFKREDDMEEMAIVSFAISAEAKFRGRTLQHFMTACFDVVPNGVRKVGPPPRGELERACSRWIQTLSGK